MEERNRRVMLVGESRHLRTAAQPLLEQLGEDVGEVTVVAVPARRRLLTACAPMSGMTTPQELAEEAAGEAWRSARDLARDLPLRLVARHCTIASWRDARGLVAQHDLVLVAGRQPRLGRRPRPV